MRLEKGLLPGSAPMVDCNLNSGICRALPRPGPKPAFIMLGALTARGACSICPHFRLDHPSGLRPSSRGALRGSRRLMAGRKPGILPQQWRWLFLVPAAWPRSRQGCSASSPPGFMETLLACAGSRAGMERWGGVPGCRQGTRA